MQDHPLAAPLRGASAIQLKKKQGKRALGRGRSAACDSALPLIMESGSLSVVLPPEETAGGVLGTVNLWGYSPKVAYVAADADC